MVARYTEDYDIDENGVYTLTQTITVLEVAIVCLQCGARHAADHIHDDGAGRHTIALEYESDPDPAVTVAIAFRGGVVEAIGADMLAGLVVIDEDREEIGRFIARPDQTEWWERMKKLEATIKEGDHRASFKMHLLSTRGSVTACGKPLAEVQSTPEINDVRCRQCLAAHGEAE